MKDECKERGWIQYFDDLFQLLKLEKIINSEDIELLNVLSDEETLADSGDSDE